MKKMNEIPFNLLYYDTWRDNYDNPTFATHIDVKEIITKTDIFTIKYNGTIGDSGANYIGFKFTPNYDLENVNINITIYVKSDNGKAKAVISFIKSIVDLVAILYYVVIFFLKSFIVIIIIFIVFITISVIVAIVKFIIKRRPPRQLKNNNPNQKKNLPQQPQYHPPEIEIVVQPQDPPIEASTQ